jgi:Transposase Tn5 dimerisation domain
VNSPGDAVEKLVWYAMRWKIEVFHKILKSGCRAENARLRTAERLVNLIAVFCVLSWRLFWMTMINRAAPDASPEVVLTEDEIRIIDQLAASRGPPTQAGHSLTHYVTQIAKLGGYLARAHDPPPGNTVMWRGWSRLIDIKIGAGLRFPTSCG